MSAGTPVLFDDGSKALVPPEQLSAALKDGGKVAQAMQFDDGSKGYVSLDRVTDAIHDGGMLMGTPPQPPRPDMQRAGVVVPAAGRIPGVQSPGQTVSDKEAYEGLKMGAAAGSLPLAAGATLPQIVGGVGGGVVGDAAARVLAKKAGAGEMGQEISGDVGGLAGGALGAGATNWAAAKARAVYEALPEAVQRELIGIASPRWAHVARLADALGIGQSAPPSYPGAPLPEHPGTFPGAPLPEHPGVFPGAPLPATPAPEVLNPSLVSPARTLPGMNPPEVIRPPAAPIPQRAGLALSGEVEPPSPQAPQPQPMSNTPAGDSYPRTLSGDSALRQVLAEQGNANLLKIAKSRGINVTRESQLKPGTADNLLIDKIVDDFSEDELSNVRDTYLENTRMGAQNLTGLGSEASKTVALQTYFPDLKIPAAQLARTQKARYGLSDLLQSH